ncbi:MAG: hypothetical protein R3C14_28820 [Caldilineaceae bacterium]
MSRKFKRGKGVVTAVIAAIILLNGFNLLLAHSLLFQWYADFMTGVGQTPLSRTEVAQINGAFVTGPALNTELLWAEQAMNFGFVLLCATILYLGYGWIRWLWGIGWLIKGGTGIVAALLVATHLGKLPNLVLAGLCISTIYAICALLLLFSPSVHHYMQRMQRSS